MTTVLARIAELLKMTEPAASTGMLWMHGTSVPSDGIAGYACGCIFLHTDGGAGTALYVNEGTVSSCNFNPLVGDVTATAAELNKLDGAVLTTLTPGTGISGGEGTICKTTVEKINDVFKTTFVIDLTGLHSTGAGDIIGVDGTANYCYITILGGKMFCSETPAGGDPDIDLYSATEGTGIEDGAIASLTETQLINHGDWTAGEIAALSASPAANEYLYLVAAAATDADYTAGRLIIELYGV
jgi:hypothetical protein